MSEPFVVKVQKSLSNSVGYRTMLIYDASREVEYEAALTPEVDSLAPSPREFFWATLDKKGKIHLQGKPIKRSEAEQSFENFDYPTMNPEAS